MFEKLKYFRNHDEFGKYFSNTSWLFGEKILRMFIGFFVGVWVARYLGPDQFGLLSYAQSFVGIFSVVATLGLDGILVRELVKDDSKQDVLLGTAFSLKLIAALGVLLTMVMSINMISEDGHTKSLVLIIASTTIFQSFNVIDFYLQSKVLGKYIVLANVLTLFVSSIIKVVLILNKAPLITFAYVVLLDGIVLALGYLYFYIFIRKQFKSTSLLTSWRFDKNIAKSLLKDSWPLILSAVAYTIYRRIDQVMLHSMIGNEEVGQYSTAAITLDVFYFLPLILVTTFFPNLVSTFSQKDVFYNRILLLYRIVILLAILLITFSTLFGQIAMSFLYGDSYQASGSIFIILSYSFVFESLAHVNGKWILLKNCQIISLYRTLFGAFLNVGLNCYLIPKYGAIGAAYATVITLFMVATLYYWIHKETKEIFFMQIKALTSFLLVMDLKKK